MAVFHKKSYEDSFGNQYNPPPLKYLDGQYSPFHPGERKTAPPKNGHPLFYWQKPIKEGVAVFRSQGFHVLAKKNHEIHALTSPSISGKKNTKPTLVLNTPGKRFTARLLTVPPFLLAKANGKGDGRSIVSPEIPYNIENR